MLDDIEDMIKQKLLEHLIESMGDKSGDRLKPPMAVEVAAKDKAGLSDGLDKAKDALPSIPESGGEDDDESRLMDLLGEDDDEDEKDKFGRK